MTIESIVAEAAAQIEGSHAARERALASSRALTRQCANTIRAVHRGEFSEAEALLAVMDDVYAMLVTVDYPDAITGGLRRTTDALRAVLERTRGDMTAAIRQEQLTAALADFQAKIGGS